MTNNQGIMHLSNVRGGRPFCRQRLAIMSTTIEAAGDWSRLCVRCERSLAPAERQMLEKIRKTAIAATLPPAGRNPPAAEGAEA